MFPDEAAAAAGQFAYAVKADKARWGTNSDPEQVIFSERAHPDNSEIELNFWTRTQFNTMSDAGFKVVFNHGKAVSITRLATKQAEARLTEEEATGIAEEAAKKH